MLRCHDGMALWTRFPVSTALLLLVFGSCSPNECDDLPAGLERDTCRFEKIQTLAPAQVVRVGELAAQIQDPVIRSAAVDTWLRDHRGALEDRDGVALCELLEPAAYGRCRRWFSAAHLQR